MAVMVASIKCQNLLRMVIEMIKGEIIYIVHSNMNGVKSQSTGILNMNIEIKSNNKRWCSVYCVYYNSC